MFHTSTESSVAMQKAISEDALKRFVRRPLDRGIVSFFPAAVVRKIFPPVAGRGGTAATRRTVGTEAADAAHSLVTNAVVERRRVSLRMLRSFLGSFPDMVSPLAVESRQYDTTPTARRQEYTRTRELPSRKLFNSSSFGTTLLTDSLQSNSIC